MVAIFSCVDASVPGHKSVSVTPPCPDKNAVSRIHEQPKQRAVITQMSTCGYANGDLSKPRTAQPGFNCRVDITRGLWGFCPTTVFAASDCGLAGACIDQAACSTGCGMIGTVGITTLSCTQSKANFCSILLLDSGVDQTFSYIACGPQGKTDTLLATATTATIASMISTDARHPSSTTTTTSSFTTALPELSQSVPTPTSELPSLPLSSAEPASTDQQQSTAISTVNTGAVIGGVIGGLALLCATGLSVVYLLRRDRQRRRKSIESRDGGIAITQPSLEKKPTSYNAVPLLEADSSALARQEIQPMEMYSSSTSSRLQRQGEVAELGC